MTIPARPRQIRASNIDLSGAQAGETPSQQIISRSVRVPAMVTDALNRSLKVKKLGMVDHMRIRRVLGAELSKNEAYLAIATLAFCVIEMDGETVIPPANVREVEHFVDKLGEEGAAAIGKAYSDQGWAPMPDDDTVGFDLDAAKN